jgi:hypothetical protein
MKSMNHKRASFISFPKISDITNLGLAWLPERQPDKRIIFRALNYVTETQIVHFLFDTMMQSILSAVSSF